MPVHEAPAGRGVACAHSEVTHAAANQVYNEAMAMKAKWAQLQADKRALEIEKRWCVRPRLPSLDPDS